MAKTWRLTLLAVFVICFVSALADVEVRQPFPDWLTKEWAKKDPFAGKREVIENEYRLATNKIDFLNSLDKKWQTTGNSLDMFRFLVASFRRSQEDQNFSLGKAYIASYHLYVPTSLEVARARFIVSANYDWSPDLCAVGERLLKTQEEFDVRYQLAKMYEHAIDFNMVRYLKAKEAVKRVIAMYPDRMKAHGLLASVYYCGYKQLKIKEDRELSIKHDKIFLASNPPESAYVKKVRFFMKKLESEAPK